MNRTRLTILCAGVALAGTLAGCQSTNTNSANAGNAVVTNQNANMNANSNMNANINSNMNSNMNGNMNAGAGGGTMRVSEVTGNMSGMTGRTVTVEGYAERAYGANAFRLDEDTNFTGGVESDLLVVARAGTIPAGMRFGSPDARVRVTGTVRPVVVSEIEREVGRQGDVALRTVEAEFRNAPAIIATSVQAVGGSGQGAGGGTNQGANQNANQNANQRSTP